MNKKLVYQVDNNKKIYTMMHGQPNINKNCGSLSGTLQPSYVYLLYLALFMYVLWGVKPYILLQLVRHEVRF